MPGAIGAALMTWHKIGRKSKKRISPHDHAYWGPSLITIIFII